MSISISAGDTKRGDFFFIDPFQIETREELRGRHIPPTADKIVELAVSILAHGQLQPIQCRRMEGNRLLLTLGFTRMAAIRLIRSGFLDTEGIQHCDPEIKIKAVVNDANDETAFIQNVVENAHRNETSAIDDAYNQDRLRDRYGKTDAEIARLYQYRSPGKVGQLRQLLTLSGDVQKRVHSGELSMQAALDMRHLPEPEQIELAQQKPSASTVRQIVREKSFEQRPTVQDLADTMGQMSSRILNDDGHGPAPVAPTTASVKPKALSMREVREFVAELQGHDQKRVRALGEALAGWIAGKEPKCFVIEALEAMSV